MECKIENGFTVKDGPGGTLVLRPYNGPPDIAAASPMRSFARPCYLWASAPNANPESIYEASSNAVLPALAFDPC
jgi:hypothetical protein